MAITLSDATTALAAWVAADLATATGQSYSIGNRTLTRVDAEEIRNNINYWAGIESGLQRTAAGESKTSVKLVKFT